MKLTKQSFKHSNIVINSNAFREKGFFSKKSTWILGFSFAALLLLLVLKDSYFNGQPKFTNSFTDINNLIQKNDRYKYKYEFGSTFNPNYASKIDNEILDNELLDTNELDLELDVADGDGVNSPDQSASESVTKSESIEPGLYKKLDEASVAKENAARLLQQEIAKTNESNNNPEENAVNTNGIGNTNGE